MQLPTVWITQDQYDQVLANLPPPGLGAPHRITTNVRPLHEFYYMGTLNIPDWETQYLTFDLWVFSQPDPDVPGGRINTNQWIPVTPIQFCGFWVACAMQQL